MILIKGEYQYAGGFQGQVSVAVNCGSVCGAGVWCALCSVLGARRERGIMLVGRWGDLKALMEQIESER